MNEANSLVAGDAVEETAGRPLNLKDALDVVVAACVVNALEAGAPTENVKGELDGAEELNPLKLAVGPLVFSEVSSSPWFHESTALTSGLPPVGANVAAPLPPVRLGSSLILYSNSKCSLHTCNMINSRACRKDGFICLHEALRKFNVLRIVSAYFGCRA